MSLLSLGRNVVVGDALDVAERRAETPDEKKKVDEARKSILEALTPWIPGDFIVSYGVLLTAWTQLRASFRWLLVVAVVSSIAFVVGGAFAASGFRRSRKGTGRKLAVRSIIGALVSVLAAIAIPNSGWYDFKGFVDNELPWLVTAAIMAPVIVLALKGAEKRWKIALGG